MSRLNLLPELNAIRKLKPFVFPHVGRRGDLDPARAEQHQQSNFATDFWLAQAAFQRGEYAKAVELASGIDDRIAEATNVRRYAVPANPEAAIIVVSHQSSGVVPLALKAIKEQVADLNAELVFVDNGNEALSETVESTFESFTFLRPPINVGCSSGRNLGVRYTTADIVVFIDDDGIIEPGCIRALLNRMRSSGAATCRGRILPLAVPAVKPAHYDLGLSCIPSIPNGECASAWRRELFDEFGGFDPLLSGHEGLKLCAETYRFFGPLGFLYEPGAVIRHDYAPDELAAEQKKQKHASNDKYLEFCGLKPDACRSLFFGLRRNPRERYLVAKWEATAQPRVPSMGTPRITVLTTAKNSSAFIADYSRAWKSQSCSDFEIVFVDDGSTDDTAVRIQAAWRGDPRLRLIKTEGIGRSKALNLALANSRTDLCMINDVDDISRQDRTAWTLDSFERNPDYDCVSFHTFDERFPFFGGRPNSPFAHDVMLRQLFGTPVSFRTFAFRKSSFPQPFDTRLKATVDFDWLVRNFRERRIHGRVIPVPLVYRRVHEGQISAVHKDNQEATAIRIINENFSAVLGPLDDFDKATIAKLIERVPITAHDELGEVYEWLMKFLAENRRKEVYDPDSLDEYFLTNFAQMRVASKPAPARHPKLRKTYGELYARGGDLYRSGRFKHAAKLFLLAAKRRPSTDLAFRAAAEAFLADGKPRMARRALKQAQRLNPSDPRIRRRLHATRWPFRIVRDSISTPFSVP